MNALRNTSQDSPQILLSPAEVEYDVPFPEAARFVEVDASADASVLVLRDIGGIDVKFTFAVERVQPVRIPGQWAAVVGDGAEGVGDGTLEGGTDTALTDITVYV